MKKILDALDFAKGYKTQVSGVLLFISIGVNLIWKIDVSETDLTEIVFQLLDQLEILVTVCGAIYGLVMKGIRLFK